MPNTDVDTAFAQPAATVAAVAVPSAGERVRAAILAQEAVVLTLHNQDSSGAAAQVVLFKKNSAAPDAPVLAWKVVRCPPGQLVRVVVPFPQQIGVFDRHGVHAGVQNAFAGDSLTISSAASQADARAQLHPHGLKYFLQQQIGVEVERVVGLDGCGFRLGKRPVRYAPYVEASIAHRRQVTKCDQPIIGLDCREVADFVVLGKFTDRGQFAARAQALFFDRQADTGDDLADQ